MRAWPGLIEAFRSHLDQWSAVILGFAKKLFLLLGSIELTVALARSYYQEGGSFDRVTAVLIERIDQERDNGAVAGRQIHQRQLLVQVVAQRWRVMRRNAAWYQMLIYTFLFATVVFGLKYSLVYQASIMVRVLLPVFFLYWAYLFLLRLKPFRRAVI